MVAREIGYCYPNLPVMNSIVPSIELAKPPRLQRVAATSTVAQSATTTVVVAHFDAVVSAGIAAILTGAGGFSVIVKEPGNLALSAGDSEQADVVIADYKWGLRLIEADPGLSRRMLILTDSDRQAKILHALQRGVRGYLLSGCSLAELIQGVRVVQNGGVALHPLAASRIAETMSQPELTQREKTILTHMMLGMTNKRIAARHGISEGTVKTHVKSILSKLNVVSRTQAVVVAQGRGLIEEASGAAIDLGSPGAVSNR